MKRLLSYPPHFVCYPIVLVSSATRQSVWVFLPVAVSLNWLLNLAAKILIIIELYKSFDAFSVVCSDFVRSFVVVLFGRLEHRGATCPPDLAEFGQRPLVPGFAEGFSLNIATFSARLRIIYGIFRIFALEFINNCNYDSTDSFNRGCFHA